MGAHAERSPAAGATRNRCRCGHFPTDHMRVVPGVEPGASGFRLEAVGPCARCGEAACPRFTGSA